MQRVPDTEKRGRRHSSEVTVVVLPEADLRAFRLDRSQVRLDTFRASGAGGQHRNKTDSGVRLLHLPTGIIVTATEERSQHQNREVAWSRLDARLREMHEDALSQGVNQERQKTLSEFRTWTWCGWRDEVKGPGSERGSMKRALSGKLRPLLRE